MKAKNKALTAEVIPDLLPKLNELIKAAGLPEFSIASIKLEHDDDFRCDRPCKPNETCKLVQLGNGTFAYRCRPIM